MTGPQKDWRRWTTASSRMVLFDGQPVFTVQGHHDQRGILYDPVELDQMTRVLVGLLNTARVDGSKVLREELHDPIAPENMAALNVGQIDDNLLEEWLRHPNANVRALAADEKVHRAQARASRRPWGS